MTKASTRFKKGNTAGRWFEEGNNISRKHGIRAAQERGIAALGEVQSGYFSKLRAAVESQPGRRDLRLDLAAMAQWLADAFFSRMLEELESGADLLESPAAKRVGYHIGLSSRILDSIPDEEAIGDSAAIILDSIDEGANE